MQSSVRKIADFSAFFELSNPDWSIEISGALAVCKADFGKRATPHIDFMAYPLHQGRSLRSFRREKNIYFAVELSLKEVSSVLYTYPLMR